MLIHCLRWENWKKLGNSGESCSSARLSVQSSESGPPTPLTASECCPPPLWVQGGDTIACGGGDGDPIPTKGQTLWYSMYTIITLRLPSIVHPPFPQQVVSLSKSSCVSPVKHTDGREGGRGAKSYNRKRAWSSRNHQYYLILTIE